MKYFKNIQTGEVFGYDETDTNDEPYIIKKQSNPNFVEVTGAWPPSPTAAELLEQTRASIAPISPRQIRQALTRAGLRASVEAAVSAGDQDMKDWWEFATSFERLNPKVLAMGAALGQTPEQLDSLWELGSIL